MTNDTATDDKYCTICDKTTAALCDDVCGSCWTQHGDDYSAAGNALAALWAYDKARRARRADTDPTVPVAPCAADLERLS